MMNYILHDESDVNSTHEDQREYQPEDIDIGNLTRLPTDLSNLGKLKQFLVI